MMPLAVGICLLGGALMCLLAAIGVLRLPDAFMRMHAATKAGVVGCGLILIGVALADGSAATGIKVVVAIFFLLLTTPVAGHLLGRAAYVSGAPFWRGTVEDQLEPVLRRQIFGPDRLQESSPMVSSAFEVQPPAPIKKIVIALTVGPHINAAIRQAIALARHHDAELCGIAIIDAPCLSNVGPVPLGAGYNAMVLRKGRMAKARQAAADVIERFESQAKDSDLRWSVRVEEGRPQAILQTLQETGCVVAVAPDGWFDQGVLQISVNVARRLVVAGVSPVFIFGKTPKAKNVRRIHFVHDGSKRSLNTWRRLIEANPWPQATLVVGETPGSESVDIEHLLHEARRCGYSAERGGATEDPDEYVVIGNAGGHGWLPEWLIRLRPANDEKVLAMG